MRLCSEFIPDRAKVTACMKAKHAQISKECRVAMAGGGAAAADAGCTTITTIATRIN